MSPTQARWACSWRAPRPAAGHAQARPCYYLVCLLHPEDSAADKASGAPRENGPRRFPLAKKRSTDAVGGELCLGFEVLDAISYAQVCRRSQRRIGEKYAGWWLKGDMYMLHQMDVCTVGDNPASRGEAPPSLRLPTPQQAVTEVEAESDPALVASSLARRALHVQLHSINGLLANGLLPTGATAGAEAAVKGMQQGVALGAASSPRVRNSSGACKPAGSRTGGERAQILLIRYGRFCLEKPLTIR